MLFHMEGGSLLYCQGRGRCLLSLNCSVTSLYSGLSSILTWHGMQYKKNSTARKHTATKIKPLKRWISKKKNVHNRGSTVLILTRGQQTNQGLLNVHLVFQKGEIPDTDDPSEIFDMRAPLVSQKSYSPRKVESIRLQQQDHNRLSDIVRLNKPPP